MILELGLSEEQFEILDMVKELLSDGTVVLIESITRTSLGGPAQEQVAKASEDETSANVYLAAVPSIERTEYTDAQIDKALSSYSLLDPRPADIRYLLVINYERLGDDYALQADHFVVLVIDEAHRLKEPTAMWTRLAFDFAAKVPSRYLLTGTPVLIRET